MASGDMAIRILLTANDGASATVGRLGNTLGMLATNPMAAVAVGAAAMGAALIGFGAVSVKAAADFQSAMSKVALLAAPANENIQQMGQAMLQLAVDTGQTPQDLAQGLYMVESAGFHGQAAIDLLRQAAEAGAVSMTKMSVIADAATSAVNAFGQKNLDAKTAIDVMVATVSAGKMEFDAYARVVGNLSAKAAIGKVSFQEANAALALFTRTGESAQLSATHLGALFIYLGTQTDKMAKAAKGLGLSFDAAKFNSLDLAGKMHYLMQITGGNFAEIQKLMGGNKTLATTFVKLAQNSGTYSDILKGLQHSQGTTANAFEKASQTYNVQMAKLNASFEVLKITIGTALLPLLSNLMGRIAPIINGWVKWITQSHILEKTIAFLTPLFQAMMNTVMTLLPPVINAFMVFVGWLRQLYTWAAHNQSVLEALKVIAIALGAVLVIILAAGLLLVAVALGTLTLAIAVIVAPIAGIIWLIRNWGTVVKWLQGLWNGFVNWLKSVFGAIGAWFVGIWQNMTNGAKSKAGDLVSGIKGIFTGAIDWLKGIWQNAVNTVVGWFRWLYDHNYYFHNLVDIIRAVISGVISWLTNAWQTVTGWITSKWQWLTQQASTNWGIITSTIHDRITQAWNFIVSIWTTVVRFLQGVWTTITGAVKSGWQTISGIFGGAWSTYIVGPLTSIGNNIKNFFLGLANQAIGFGKGIIQGFINGIQSMIGGVQQAASNVVNAAKNFLGFHSPAKEGPGRDIHLWGQGMIDGFITGMHQAQPRLHAALNGMLVSPGSGGAFALGGGSSGGSGTMTIRIYLDGKQISEAVGVRMGREMRLQGTVRNS